MAESTDQMVLVSSPVFTTRMQYLMVKEAGVVLAEAAATAHHAARVAYAQGVVSQPAQYALTASVMVVGGINLIGTVTGSGATADSSASDAAIFGQISAFWSALAGIDTGN